MTCWNSHHVRLGNCPCSLFYLFYTYVTMLYRRAGWKIRHFRTTRRVPSCFSRGPDDFSLVPSQRRRHHGDKWLWNAAVPSCSSEWNTLVRVLCALKTVADWEVRVTQRRTAWPLLSATPRSANTKLSHGDQAEYGTQSTTAHLWTSGRGQARRTPGTQAAGVLRSAETIALWPRRRPGKATHSTS